VLLRGTIAENIALGDPAAPAPRIRAAAAAAGADGFVRALPSGYATVVGDGGRELSPGERRRIALARALLRDAPLVILDEPTADLDPASVAAVAGALRELATRHTVLLIAHRPELVEHADRVVRLARGSVRREPIREAA
jgi:ATP-binding cassette subfamily C protein CydD